MTAENESITIAGRKCHLDRLTLTSDQLTNNCNYSFKKDMWEKVAKEMAMPWRAVEARHWGIGQSQMAKLAGVTTFSTTSAPLDYSPLPHNATPTFAPEYQPSSLRQSFNPYEHDQTTHLPTRMHPMEPPPRPDHPPTSYGDPRAGDLPGPMQILHQDPSFAYSQHTAHPYHFSTNDRNLPPLEGQQLPPMRLSTEPRRTDTQQDPRGTYSNYQEYRSDEHGKKEEPYSERR